MKHIEAFSQMIQSYKNYDYEENKIAKLLTDIHIMNLVHNT